MEVSPSNWKKTPTERIRELDMYRLHVPSPEEREKMRIPQSDERMRMNDHLHVMILCGGYAGVHFTSEVCYISFCISND